MAIINGFNGIHNTVSARQIADNDLYDAVDVMLNNDKALLSRPGYELAQVIALQSAYTCADGTTYLVSNDRLLRADGINNLVDLAECHANEFCDQSETLFTQDGLMVHDGKVTALTIPAPPAPVVTLTNGDLPAGLYNVVATYVNLHGLMSGASPVVTVKLSAPGGFRVDVPPLTDFRSEIFITDVFASDPGEPLTGGEVFYSQSTGMALDPLFIGADSYPAQPDKIAWYDSKLFVSELFDGYTAVYYSKRLHYHLWDYASDFFIIPGQVLTMIGTDSALLLGTATELYAYDGNALTRLCDYGVVSGRPFARHPTTKTMYIHTTRGICTFPFANLTEDRLSLPTGSLCSTAVIHCDGIVQFIALHNGGANFNPFIRA